MKIFIAGVHGVGKGTYATKIMHSKFTHYSCSDLIHKMNKQVYAEKIVEDINDNQYILNNAINLFVKEKDVIYDGHFVLINNNRELEKIPMEVYRKMDLSEIIVLIAEPYIIKNRLIKRDIKTWMTDEEIDKFQNLEIEYAMQVANELKIPIKYLRWRNNEWNTTKMHALKIQKKYYEEILEGRKKYEIRFNDRNFSIGDSILLKEINGSEYTGRQILKRIVTITDDFEPLVEINYVVFGIE